MAQSPKKKERMKYLPNFWKQMKQNRIDAQPNLMSKYTKEFKDGVEPRTEVKLMRKKFTKKPRSAKQKEASKKMMIACAIIERKNDNERKEAMEQTKMRNNPQMKSTLGQCKDCGQLVHRMTSHTEYECMRKIMKGIKKLHNRGSTHKS